MTKKLKWADSLSEEDFEWVLDYLGSKIGNVDKTGLREALLDLYEKSSRDEILIRNLESAYRARRSRRERANKISSITISSKAKKSLDRLSKNNKKTVQEMVDALLLDWSERVELIRKEAENAMMINSLLIEAGKLSQFNKKIVRLYDKKLHDALSGATSQLKMGSDVPLDANAIVTDVMNQIAPISNELIQGITKSHERLERIIKEKVGRKGSRKDGNEMDSPRSW